VEIYQLDSDTGGFEVSSFLHLAARRSGAVEVGSAHFPKHMRHPAEGFSVHDQTEISLVLTGGFSLETPQARRQVHAGEVVVIPAGMPHASTALDDSSVYYVLFD